MHYYFKLSLSFVVSNLFIPICVAQNPYSADGDTAYLGENALVRDKSTSHVTGPIPNSFNTITSTTWSEDIRLTYLAEIGGIVNPPKPFLNDNILGVFTAVTNLSHNYNIFKTFSYDFGVSWSTPDTIYIESISINRAGGVDTIIYFLGVTRGTFKNSFFMRSFDNAVTWQDYHEFEENDVGYIGKGTLNPLRDSLFITYYLPARQSIDIDSIMFSMSDNRGSSWSDTRGVINASNDNYSHWVRISFLRMHIAFQSFGLDSQEIYYSFSDDYGLSWADPISISEDDSISSQWPFLSADDAGNLCVSWFDYKYGSGPSGFTGDLLYRISQDNGESWGDENRLTYDHLCTASRSVIDGEYIAFIWLDHYLGWLHGNLSFMESCDSGNTWSNKIELTNNGSEHNVMSPEILYDGDNIYLFWLDDRDSYLFNHEIYFKKGEVFTTSIFENQVVPIDFAITSIYPNPFNNSTVIDIACKQGEQISLSVYDVRGSKVKTIFENFLSTSQASYIWDGTNQDKEQVKSGVYFFRLKSNEGCDVRKAVLLK